MINPANKGPATAFNDLMAFYCVCARGEHSTPECPFCLLEKEPQEHSHRRRGWLRAVYVFLDGGVRFVQLSVCLELQCSSISVSSVSLYVSFSIGRVGICIRIYRDLCLHFNLFCICGSADICIHTPTITQSMSI